MSGENWTRLSLYRPRAIDSELRKQRGDVGRTNGTISVVPMLAEDLRV
jgi:hypothetical protein